MTAIITPVCIIGCGPIGLTGALLLSRMGIKCVIVDRRGELNTHPRSRFVDTNTMELMRELGIEKEVEDTGLGPDWTKYNRWVEALNGKEVISIYSPTFHTVPRDTSPCLPVMTCQDYVENELAKIALKDPNIDLRFSTEASDITQDETGVHLNLKNIETGKEERVEADYMIGADGPSSWTRKLIGARYTDAQLAGNMQDVIFDADLSDYVGDRKGALLYAITPAGLVIFQPLNGIRRWRCQVATPEAEVLPEEEMIRRIRIAAGADESLEIDIKSMSKWQPTPGNCDKFQEGRIFIAGDAAHISIPAGGMGNNSGFSGIRNLAWKLALVVKGVAPEDLLETYFEEHHQIAQERIDMGVYIFDAVVPMIRAYVLGEDMSEPASRAAYYADYDGVILGFEMSSKYIGKNKEPAPKPGHPISHYQPLIRCGRRAPHIWLDEAKTQSILDWFGTEYILIAPDNVETQAWDGAIAELREIGLPINLKTLPDGLKKSPYSQDQIILVRPDGIIADCWVTADIEAGSELVRLKETLPLKA